MDVGNRTLRRADIISVMIETVETADMGTVLAMAAGALGWCMPISRIPH